jgi:hypothetical protein
MTHFARGAFVPAGRMRALCERDGAKAFTRTPERVTCRRCLARLPQIEIVTEGACNTSPSESTT